MHESSSLFPDISKVKYSLSTLYPYPRPSRDFHKDNIEKMRVREAEAQAKLEEEKNPKKCKIT